MKFSQGVSQISVNDELANKQSILIVDQTIRRLSTVLAYASLIYVFFFGSFIAFSSYC